MDLSKQSSVELENAHQEVFAIKINTNGEEEQKHILKIKNHISTSLQFIQSFCSMNSLFLKICFLFCIL